MGAAISGLEIFLQEHAERYRGARLGLCCNPTAIDREYRHAADRIEAAGLDLRRLFGPEHGARSTAQDMIFVTESEATAGEATGGERPAGPEVVSLYGDSEGSLKPAAEHLADLDAILFDIQDIGARYYTYQATLGFIMQVAAETGAEVVVLDRPNPITGVHLEGNVVRPGFESFVSAWPMATRHGMTVGELARWFKHGLGIDARLTVIEARGWRRDQWFDETGLPWVFPSPNMPTLETAILYPGMCLFEGTNLSEGRGTTRPFHLIGAPWLDPRRFTDLCRKGAQDSGLQGVAFREASFLPQFQKHAGQICGGIEAHVTDRDALESVLMGWVVLEAARRCDPERFAWRTEIYEFVEEPIAIDLLCGSVEGRLGIEAGVRPRDLIEGWRSEMDAWDEAREPHLLY